MWLALSLAAFHALLWTVHDADGFAFASLFSLVAVALVLGVLAREEPSALLVHLHAGRLRWATAIGLCVLFVFGVFGWSGESAQAGAVVTLASTAVAGWYLTMAWRTRTWIEGQVRVRENVQLVTANTIYMLDALPRGCRDGDWLALPSVEIDELKNGPYRSGRPAGRAPEVFVVQRTKLTRTLLARGLGYLAWALVCGYSLVS